MDKTSTRTSPANPITDEKQTEFINSGILTRAESDVDEEEYADSRTSLSDEETCLSQVGLINPRRGAATVPRQPVLTIQPRRGKNGAEPMEASRHMITNYLHYCIMTAYSIFAQFYKLCKYRV
jgi:hypothetical protein